MPVKGTSGQFAAMKVLDFIKECGAAETEIILKTDQEPAIEALMADVLKTRGAAITVLQKSPVGSGVVERGVQCVELIRTLMSSREDGYKDQVGRKDRDFHGGVRGVPHESSGSREGWEDCVREMSRKTSNSLGHRVW